MAVAIQETGKILGSYIAGIYLSLVIFRLFLNPLNKFPGRPLSRLSALDHSFRVGKDKDMFLKLYQSHKQLGKFVRTGPNDLSVTHPDVVRVALSSQAVCEKAPWYEGEAPAWSLQSTRVRSQHDRRRRIWSPAFSDKALRGYEKRVHRYNECLILHIDSFSGQPVDMSQWFNYWSFDVMGDLAFGRSFNMMESAGEHWAIKLLNSSQDGMGLALPPWIGRLCWHIAPLRSTCDRFLKFCASEIENRILLQGKQENPDITHYLIEDLNAKDAEGQRDALPLLYLDSKLIIVAGSDTTAATLTFLFYHLAIEPSIMTRLRDELETISGDAGNIEHQYLQCAPLLNACINETLRLHPPVPSGLYRKTPPDGVYIGDEWIPGNTTIQIHLYSMARDESNFAMAEQFIPERFYSRPELVKNKDAFAPFSIGPYGCIGKNLAYMEIRLLTAQLITKFDVALAPDEDGTALLNSVDHFTIGLKPIKMILSRRKSVARER
ncbi:uncharacterized protein Z520_10391 [Fonsecaea multimorphosa CBS 102226]|uniref:Cytochrome P450 n=1 Tax=Fonsecaea multimorphosa CBS 102226 TaxID=1442371 RepID=A0A0D2JKH2_9EURO|nr:uncharacterized protein Z520_10391 [Fonsecaea multimorphosa CBS 102226]KIX93767.1 hypothetical protein Z520_10391 [Fonsecaea multimorphosa CBS 102226]OAL19197.1 hypothetical protein AYO22_09958 [Fonsecaea multimorphosa]